MSLHLDFDTKVVIRLSEEQQIRMKEFDEVNEERGKLALSNSRNDDLEAECYKKALEKGY